MPAVVTNVVATDSPVNASSTNAIVTPVSAEYRMNSSDAVDAASCCTRADSTNTIASWAIASAQNSAPLDAIVPMIFGDPATNQAVPAVIASPPHIHPYTPFPNAP